MPRILSDRIIFDRGDWEPGLLPYFASGGIFRGSSGLIYSGAFDPLRTPGYASPAFEPASATNAPTAISGNIMAGVQKNASTAYLLAADAEIHEYSVTGHSITNGGGTFPHAISAHGGHASVDAGVTGGECDAILYQHNSGGSLRTSAFYSWNDNTDWDVGTYGDLSGTPAFDDDFMSTVPASPLAGSDLTGGKGYPHPFEIGRDGILYMGAQRYIHAYDGTNGTNGTFESQVLDLAQGFVITSLLQAERYMIAFAYRPPTPSATVVDAMGETRAFFWDLIDPETFQYSELLDDNYVTGGFLFRGLPACFTFGRSASPISGRGKLRVRTGGRWRIVCPTTDYPVNRGVKMLGERAVWATNGMLMSYGAGSEGFADGLNRIGVINGSGRGFVGNFTGTTIVTSAGNDFQRFVSGYAAAEFQTQYARPLVERGYEAQVESVQVKFRKAATGGRNLELNLYCDGGAKQSTFFSSETITASKLIRNYNIDTSGAPLPKFQDLSIYAIWGTGSGSNDAPVIEEIEVFYKPVALNQTQ